MPQPSAKLAVSTTQSGPSSAKTIRAHVAKVSANTRIARVRPIRRATCPDKYAPTTVAPRNGTTSKPLLDASTPKMSWKYSGSRNVAPNSPSELTHAINTPRRNTLSPNSRGGRIGSGARRSCQTSRPSRTTADAAVPRIIGDDHGYSTPPQLSVSKQHVTPPTRNAAPAQSI